MQFLASKHCVSCETAKPFTTTEANQLLNDLPGWVLADGSIEKDFRFKSYRAGLEFAYAMGKIAEQENHHPDIGIFWRRVRLTLSTHAIKGLSQNDFIMAAKAELEYERLRSSRP